MLINELQIVAPIVSCFLHHAYPLTAAQAHKDFYSWFYSNYIQLEYDLNNESLNFFTRVICGISVYSPILEYKILDSELLYLSHVSVIDFVIDCINMGYYFTVYLDEFYMPERSAYRKFHNRHENMIWGYDLNNKNFKTIGYNNKAQYLPSCISFTEFWDSYINCVDKKNDVMMFKAKDELSYESTFNFDVVNVINLLEDYYFSRDTSEKLRILNNPKKGFTYGLSVYNELIKYFESVIDNNKEFVDIRLLHLLWEHKKCMVSRIEYLIANKFVHNDSVFIDKYIYLQNEALSLRNLLMKYKFTKNKNNIGKIIKSLPEMYTTEKQLILYLLDHLKLGIG